MQNSRANTIRGLSIAVVIVSILSLVFLILIAAVLGLSAYVMTDASMESQLESALYLDHDSAEVMDEYNLSASDVIGMATLVIGLGGSYVAWSIICSLITLIAGITGIRNCKNTEKLGRAFVWAVVGTVAAFLYGNIVLVILLIISAVCINRDRKEATSIPYGQPAAYTQTPGQQGYYAPPQTGYYSPTQPYAGYGAPQNVQPGNQAGMPQQGQTMPQNPKQDTGN